MDVVKVKAKQLRESQGHAAVARRKRVLRRQKEVEGLRLQG